MTVHAERDERIRLLREAIERAMRMHEVTVEAYRMLEAALLADDALAAMPPPDLPLAEGSRWSMEPFSSDSLIDEFGDEYELDSSGGAAFLTGRDEERCTESAWLSDVLALARREGLV